MKFAHKKSLGQNFLTNKNLISALVSDAKVTKDINVLEIGAGMGSLTSQLAISAKQVLAIETDLRLKPILEEKFVNSNVSFIFDDFLNVDFSTIENILGKNYIVVANLPYYITTPILYKFFEECNGATRIVVMVQKEVALRMVSNPGGKDYGVLSVACQHMGETKILRNVSRQNFNPIPNVDSAFVEVNLKNKDDVNPFFHFVRQCFAMRRKTLVNNLKNKYDCSIINKWLINKKIALDIRAETLSPLMLYDLFVYISNFYKI